MLMGGSYTGNRLSKIYKESVEEPEILALLENFIGRYAKERDEGEKFGDWVIRAGIVKATTHGTNFYKHTSLDTAE
jgi:sulfite reductase (NADPH) hemoprotein beta-component